MRGLLAAFACVLPFLAARADLVWPTESTAFGNGAAYTEFIQPTASGRPESGLFGDIRNNGYNFHEAIDIKPIRRDRKGEALDSVFSAFSGKVVLINKVAGNSSYGRYVVMEHPQLDVNVYTLYAHLAEVEPTLKVGAKLPAKSRLGKMGRSSSSIPIAKAQAHLHFEIGLMYGNNFNSWYSAQKYKNKNYFGNYNGMNLQGFDPLAFYQAARGGKIGHGMAGYIQSLPTAAIVRVYTKKIPDFVRNYPALVDNNGQKCGWDIHLTWYGLPIKFERIKKPKAGAKEGEVEIVYFDMAEKSRRCKSRKMIILDKRGNPQLTRVGKTLLAKLGL